MLGLIASGCVFAAHAALVMGPTLSQLLAHWGIAAGRQPKALELALTVPMLLFVAASRPTFLHLSFSGSFHYRTTVLVASYWAVGSTVLWLASVFFLSDLSTLDRTFVVLFCALLLFVLAFLGLFVQAIVAAPAMLMVMVPCGLGVAILLLATGSTGPILDLFHPGQSAAAMLQRMGRAPIVYVSSYMLAGALAWAFLVAFDRFRRYAYGVMIVFGLFVWVGVTHLIWMLILFGLGYADLPRWLPLMTALASGLGAPIGAAIILLRSSGSLSDRLYAGFIDQANQSRPGMKAEILRPEKPLRNANGRRAWIISFTGVSNEPRVLRQAKAMAEAGWDLVVCGFDGHSDRPEEWTFIRLPKFEPYDHRAHRIAKWARYVAVRGMPLAQLFGDGTRAARIAHDSNLYWNHIRQELVRLARERTDLRADLVIAHDYHTSDVGFEVSQVCGAKFSIDVHEYAREQYSNIPDWVKWEQPVIIGVQDYYLRRADNVTVVCQGIADLLEAETPMKARPTVIRNFPFLNVQTFRPVGERIKVLYHGDLSRPRQIHVALQSMPKWRNEFDLILRGSGDAGYIGELKRLVERLGLQSRVFFEPAVPFEKIVEAANQADIGFFSYEAYSPQIRFALPNKLFEYVMAGLAVCISDLEEVGRVVTGYRLGKLIPQHTPDSIAETINSFTRQEIETFKVASLKAANELNWDAESKRLISSYDELFIK